MKSEFHVTKTRDYIGQEVGGSLRLNGSKRRGGSLEDSGCEDEEGAPEEEWQDCKAEVRGMEGAADCAEKSGKRA